MEQVSAPFNKKGRWFLPYKALKGNKFYLEQNKGTTNSEPFLLGIFEKGDSEDIGLYFRYKWPLKNNKVVEFDVAYIYRFDDQNKIAKPKVIYDTVVVRKLRAEL